MIAEAAPKGPGADSSGLDSSNNLQCVILDGVGAPPPQQRVGIFTGAHDLDARVQALVDRRRLEARREAADNPLAVAAR